MWQPLFKKPSIILTIRKEHRALTILFILVEVAFVFRPEVINKMKRFEIKSMWHEGGWLVVEDSKSVEFVIKPFALIGDLLVGVI